ncbi:PAS fold protein [uncultured archaeon]|nr:PAS fold protein [uncultured archaeon]
MYFRGMNTGYDISEHNLEKALQLQHTILNSIIEGTNASVFSVDTKYRYTFFNRAHSAMMLAINGANIQIGRCILDYMTVTCDKEKARQNLDRALRGERHAEEAYSGEEMRSRLYFEVSFNPITAQDGTVIGVAVLALDITERKRAEDVLKSLVMRYQTICAAVPDIIMETDINKIYTWSNKAGYEFFGDDVVGKEAAFYFEGEQEIYNIVQPLFSGIEDTIYVESWQRRKDGEKRLLAWWCHNLKDPVGTVVGTFSTARDITGSKYAEEELRKSESRYRSLFDNMLEGFAYCRMLFENNEPQDFIYLTVNRAFEELTGLSNVVGRKVSDVIPDLKDSNPEIFEIYSRVATTGNPERVELYLNSLEIWLRIYVYSLEKEYFVAVFENITMRKRAEEKLRQS